MTDRPDWTCFSGLETYALNTVQSLAPINQQDIADISAALRLLLWLWSSNAVNIEQTGATLLIIAGGVGANNAYG